MDKEKKILIALYSLAVVLLLMSFALNNSFSREKTKSPLGKGFSVLSSHSNRTKPNYYIYGFLPYWMLNKTEYLQLDKLTDIAYFALSINANGTIRKIGEDGNIDPGYNQWKNSSELNDLIKAAKATNTRFALTMISHEDDITREFLNCRACWKTLETEIIRELESKNLTDINMDFELVEPDAEDGLALKYSELVGFLNKSLDEKLGNSFVVTSTLPDSAYKARITDISSLAKTSDAIFVMAYDFHRPNSDNAGPVAPINGAGIRAEYDITTMLKDYLSLAPSNKLILGVPYYGYNWLVTSSADYAERIPGNDVLGYSISQTYEAIADTKLKYQPKVLWDGHGLVPYFTYYNPEYGTSRQVYFENPESLKIKYDIIKQYGLAGVGIWALGYDGGYQELWELLFREFIEI